MLIHIDGIIGDMHGQDTDKLNAFLPGIGMKLLPLTKEDILRPDVELDIILVFVAELLKGIQGILMIDGTELIPGLSLILFLETHEAGIIQEPVLSQEGSVASLIGTIAFLETFEGNLENPGLVPVNPGIIDPSRIISPFDIREILLFEKAFVNQIIEIDKIMIQCTVGEGLVRGIRKSRRTDRKDDPIGESASSKEVDELMCTLSDGTDSILSGKGEYR